MADLLLYDRPGLPLALRVARDDQQNFLIRSKTLPFIRPSTPVGEATYANTDPSVAGIYASDDFSEGMGQKFQRPNGKGYWYASGIDCSHGIQRGPKITDISWTPTGDVTVGTGYFELGGYPYFLLGKTIVSTSDGTTMANKYVDGVGYTLTQPATFFVLGSEASLEASTADAADQTFNNADALGAQQFRHSASGIRQLSKVIVKLKGATTNAAGDVRLRLFTDLDGSPGVDIATSRVLYKNIGTSAVAVTFRFEDQQTVYLETDAPYWLVLDMASADGTNNIVWRREASDTYARGAAKVSADGGNAWTAATGDFNFAVWGRTATQTAFIGRDTSATWLTTTDGTNYTADSYRKASCFGVIADRLVADVAGSGAIRWTDDGANWSEPILVGDPAETISALYNLNGSLVVAKSGSIWAVDIGTAEVGAIPDMQPIYSTGRSAGTNGLGGTVWRGVAFLPYARRLLALEGSFDSGFVVHESVGPESVTDWTNVLSITGVQGVAGDRFCLYAAVSSGTSETGMELMKSYDPLNRVWHGSIASVNVAGGTTTAVPRYLSIWERGASNSPLMFFLRVSAATSGTAKMAVVVLPKSHNPADDPNYLFETSGTGSLYFSVATGNFPNHQKAWVSDSLTYAKQATSDSAQMLYDLYDGQGYRTFAQPWHKTDRQSYPNGLRSTLLGRQLVMTTTTSTTSSTIIAAALEFAVRRDKDLRAFTIVVEDQDGMAGNDVSALLGLTGTTLYDRLLAATQAGTLTMQTQRGEKLRVLVQDVDESVQTLKALGSRNTAAQLALTCVQVA